MRIDFYQLTNPMLENILPKLLEKAIESGNKCWVKTDLKERADFINSMLWTYDEESFLPHGTKSDGNAELQPIYISDDDDNKNHADFLFLIDTLLSTLFSNSLCPLREVDSLCKQAQSPMTTENHYLRRPPETKSNRIDPAGQNLSIPFSRIFIIYQKSRSEEFTQNYADLKEKGFDVYLWQQSSTGKWQQA